ncbi:ATP-binding protein [Kitasatospora sp. LaBMicrA B282]|uniref:ATP-binding protein n=1 Tax=Kitasatospora sp. LaBMicrA B282 TaxID=3420949 RepID=UPI003D0A29F3
MPGAFADQPLLATHLWLPPSRRSPGLARRLVRDFLVRFPEGERFLGSAELLVSELVTNALVHATARGQLIKLGLEGSPGELLIWVEDPSELVPRMRCGAGCEGGRGLLLLDRLAKDWGWGPREGRGKRVWCCLEPDAGPEQPW